MKKKRTWHVYALIDPRTNLVRYVGVTFRGLQRRFNEQLSRARKGGRTHRDCWIRSLLNKGLSPVQCLLDLGTGDWRVAEKRWIAFYRASGQLVNHTDGGEGTPGCIPTKETREKWSKIRRGRKYEPGRRSGMLGKHHSPETRAKIAAAGRGRKHTDATKRKLSALRRGRKLSEAQKELLRHYRRGTKLTPEHRAKIAASTTGRKPVECIETGVVYPSITAAARALGVTESSVGQAVRKGVRCKGHHWRLR